MRKASTILNLFLIFFAILISIFFAHQTKKDLALFNSQIENIKQDLDNIDNSLKEFKLAMEDLVVSLENLKNRMDIIEAKVDNLVQKEAIKETQDVSGIFIYFNDQDMEPIKNLF